MTTPAASKLFNGKNPLVITKLMVGFFTALIATNHSPAFSADAVSVKICDTVLRGTKPEVANFLLDDLATQSGMTLDYEFIPDDGIGRSLVFKVHNTQKSIESSRLYKGVRDLPEFFAEHGFYADDNVLVIPDATRLNHFTSGTRYVDIAPTEPQHYTPEFFDRWQQLGFVAIASVGQYLDHDRLQEHLLGGMFVPQWMNLKREQARKGFAVIAEHALFKTNEEMARYLSLRGDGATLWDEMTNELGVAVSSMSVQANNLPYKIHKIRRTLSLFDKRLSIGAQSVWAQLELDMKAVSIPQVQQDEFAKFSNELQKNLFLVPLTDEQLLTEAIMIVHRATKLPVAEIEKLWDASVFPASVSN